MRKVWREIQEGNFWILDADLRAYFDSIDQNRLVDLIGDQLQVLVALGRRGLCRGAWLRARTRRHNDRRIRMTLADLTVDIVPIVRSIASKRRNRSGNLLEQGPTCEPSSTSLLVSSAAMICPVSASTPIWS